LLRDAAGYLHQESAMAGKYIHLCLLDMPTVSHNNYGLWAYPANQHPRYKDLDYWIEVARLLERGKFDAIFFADVLAISEGYGNGPGVALREGMHVPNIDPFLLIAAMAAVTKHLGFAVTGSTTYEPPFGLARRMSTLDHLTKGRVGWNVVTSYLPGAARNFSLDQQISHDERYEIADEYMEVVYKLWEGSWQDDAVLNDRVRQIYADPTKVHRINHVGKYYQVQGPHLAEPSPQRTPVIFQAGSSDRGRRFAAEHAEAVFVGGYTMESLRRNVADVRAAAAAAGRDSAEIKIFSELRVVVGRTEEAARAKLADLQGMSRADGYLAHRFGSGMDLSPYARSEKIEDIIAAGGPGADHIKRYPFPPGITVGEIFDDAARLDRKLMFATGNPVQVADQIEAWVDDIGLDGFLLVQHTTPGTAADFIDLVVPELQRRGRYRKEYEESTLRERFLGGGNARLPASHPGAGYRRLSKQVFF
jgi:FMN-dependent oxidoreductase (nitrilotriacetate monooxygenase family)